MDRNAISLQINSLRLFLVQALVLAVALRRLQVSQLWAVALCPPAPIWNQGKLLAKNSCVSRYDKELRAVVSGIFGWRINVESDRRFLARIDEPVLHTWSNR